MDFGPSSGRRWIRRTYPRHQIRRWPRMDFGLLSVRERPKADIYIISPPITFIILRHSLAMRRPLPISMNPFIMFRPPQTYPITPLISPELFALPASNVNFPANSPLPQRSFLNHDHNHNISRSRPLSQRVFATAASLAYTTKSEHVVIISEHQKIKMQNVNIPADSVPQGLKHIEQILKRAKELKQAEPIVSYWCKSVLKVNDYGLTVSCRLFLCCSEGFEGAKQNQRRHPISHVPY